MLGIKLKAAYIPTGKGKKYLVLNGFTFNETARNRWCCSRRKKGCKAYAKTNQHEEVVECKNEHNHEKQKFIHNSTKEMVFL